MSARPVLVGYDGSDGARNAVLWALRESGPDQALIPLAVLGSEPSSVPVIGALAPPGDADRAARRIVSRWDEEVVAVEHELELTFARGHPAEVLARAAADHDAELIVIGHRRGRRAGTLRGSVAHDLTRLAGCPVVVVPE